MPTRPVIRISVCASSSLAPNDDRREWEISVRRTHSDCPDLDLKEPIKLKLQDPFTRAEYHNYEKRQRSGREIAIREGNHLEQPVFPTNLARSQEPTMAEPVSTTGNVSKAANTSVALMMDSDSRPAYTVERYRQILSDILKLDDWAQKRSMVKISIREELQPHDHATAHYCSIHSLLWELLEHDENCFDTLPQDDGHHVQVTRWITGIGDPRDLPLGLLRPDEPIRLLLVVARNLQRLDNGRFHDPRSVVYDTLHDIVKYLERHGRHNRLSVDVVRPGTHEELERCISSRKPYDMVHLDVHGVIEETTGIPKLLFAKPHAFDAPRSDDSKNDSTVFNYVSAEVIANMMKKHEIKVVALSACLSSYAQEGSLSNMCRVFAHHGVCAITGMSFTVKPYVAEAYYAGFYSALVIGNYNFRSAAVHGRRWLQRMARKIEEKAKKAKKRKASSGRRRSSASTMNTSTYERVLTEQEQQLQHQKWPMATTYFTTHDLDRTDTATLGEDMFMGKILSGGRVAKLMFLIRTSWLPIWCILGIEFILLFVQTRMPCVVALAIMLAAYITTHVVASRLALRKEPEAELADFKSFQEGMKKAVFKHSVGLMALEDRLKSLNRLFIQIYPPDEDGGREESLRKLKNLWLATKFSDMVDVVPAGIFKSRWSAWPRIYLLRVKLSRAWHRALLIRRRILRGCADFTSPTAHSVMSPSLGTTADTRRGVQSRFRLLLHKILLVWHIVLVVRREILQGYKDWETLGLSTGDTTPSLGTILIIDELDSIVKKGNPDYKALDRMNSYIRGVEATSLSGFHLIILSDKDIGWSSNTWDPDKYWWITTEAFHAEPGFRTMNPLS